MASLRLSSMALISTRVVWWFILVLIISPEVVLSGHQFQVGGENGWVKPTPYDPPEETYNDWAASNRFHVGDAVYFKYQNDSVLVVDHQDYEDCFLSNPIFKFEDGETVFEFDRYGFFYFISGNPGHCTSGQKLIIRVMVHPGVEPPESAAASPDQAANNGTGGGGASGGDGWVSNDRGHHGFNSAAFKLSARFVTLPGSVMLFLYL